MATIFTKIIDGDIPCYKVGENEHCFAFLDIQPVTYGHVLVVPKKEVDYIFDLDDDLLAELMRFAKEIAKKMEAVIECERIGVSVIGLEVPHAHVHLMPINSITDMDFGAARKKNSEQEFIDLAQKITNA
jgi:histidine triad (HIT) family protein